MPTNFKHEDPSLRRVRPKSRTVAKARAQKRRAAEKVKKTVYAAVDKRDGGSCRSCGYIATQHHHITYRSRGGTHTTGNVILVCGVCHDAIHQKRVIVTGNGDGRVYFSYR